MVEKFIEKFIEKWPQILPTLVGLVALLVYYLQEGQKKKEAANEKGEKDGKENE